jgi:hypothetical protein
MRTKSGLALITDLKLGDQRPIDDVRRVFGVDRHANGQDYVGRRSFFDERYTRWRESGPSVLPVSVDLVLRRRFEIAGVMAFAQLSFKRSGGAVDHPPALDGRALADFFRPAH